jgi:hypothetical protein
VLYIETYNPWFLATNDSYTDGTRCYKYASSEEIQVKCEAYTTLPESNDTLTRGRFYSVGHWNRRVLSFVYTGMRLTTVQMYYFLSYKKY